MSAIFETYNCANNIFEHADILPDISFTTSETEHDSYQ